MVPPAACACLVERSDLFASVRLIMRFSGMYPLQPDQPLSNRWLRRLVDGADLLLEMFLYLCTMHVAVLFMCTLYLHVGNDDADLDFVVNCLIQMVLYSWTIAMKIYFRRVKPGSLRDLMLTFNREYRSRSAMGFTYVTMEQAASQSSKWFRYYVYLCFAGTIFWGLLPLVYNDRSLPLPCWYPFDHKAPLVYETVYFVQFIAQLQLATAYAASSGFYMALVMLISGQYDVLYCSLKNVLATAAVASRRPTKELIQLRQLHQFRQTEAGQYHAAAEHITPLACLTHCHDYGQPASSKMAFRELGASLKDSFRQCVMLQRYILRLLNKMERLYHPIWFFKFGEMTSLLCLVAFASVKTALTSLIKMVSLAQYFFLIALELLMIFYYGEVIHTNSQRCGDALLRSPWPLYMGAMKSDIVFFLLNSQRAFQLTAGKMYALNIERAKSTVTTAFSFLTLLQKMDQRA